MQTVKKYTTGKKAGYGIRQTKDKLFHVYKGNISQTANGFIQMAFAEKFINHLIGLEKV